MSKTLSATERRYPAVVKEALAIIEAVRKWNHLLSRQPFILITDKKSFSFMFDSRKRSKIKNSKIPSWRLELAEFSYAIQYREGNRMCEMYALIVGFVLSSSLSFIRARTAS